MSTIQHADLILTGASTIALDATVLGKPLICIAFDGEMKVRYWESAARFFDCFTHFEDFVTTSGVSVARSEAELQTWLVQQVSSGAQLGYDRDAVLKRFIGETGHAGKRLAATIAHAIETALKKRHVA